MKEVEDFVGPPRRQVRYNKELEIFSSYMGQVTSLREFEPTTYQEASVHQVWRDAMME